MQNENIFNNNIYYVQKYRSGKITQQALWNMKANKYKCMQKKIKYLTDP